MAKHEARYLMYLSLVFSKHNYIRAQKDAQKPDHQNISESCDFVFLITGIKFEFLKTKENPQNRDNEHPHVTQL